MRMREFTVISRHRRAHFGRWQGDCIMAHVSLDGSGQTLSPKSAGWTDSPQLSWRLPDGERFP
ncbi:hypothetical protein B7486_01620 [cyanobacterium TDX16]|nr:hypothetical protein B7486_01620 [cyanobacterium TDX16]